MPTKADYPTFSQARAHLKDILDTTAHGGTVTVARGDELTAVIPAEPFRQFLYRTTSPRVRLLPEGGRVVLLMEGRPFAAEGVDVQDALDDLLDSLVEYAEDWEGELQYAPNHEKAWALVQLVKLCTREQLRDWIENGGE